MIRTPAHSSKGVRNGTTEEGAKEAPASVPDPSLRRSDRVNKGVAPQRYDESLQKQLGGKHTATSRSSSFSFSGKLTPRSARTPSIVSQDSLNSTVKASRQLEIELRRQEELAEIERQQADRERQIIELRARLEEAKLIENESYNGQSKASNASERSVKTIGTSHTKVAHWLQQGNATNNRIPENGRVERKIGFPETRLHEKEEIAKVGKPQLNSTYMARQAMGKDLPIFKGSTTDWILFEKMFTQTTEACGFSPTENMLRLQKCLQGEALESVRALLMTTNVDRVMSVLKRRFGRAEYIIEELMQRVTNAPNVKEDRPITMIRFAESVVNLVATIESLKQLSYLTNPLLIKQLLNKLPASVKMAWGKRTVKERDGTCLREFAEWIEEEAEAASAIYQPEREKNEKRVLNCREGETPKTAEKEDKCLYCGKKTHRTDACYGFLKLSVDDRWTWVRKKRVCFGCLSTTHTIRDCKGKGCDKQDCSLKHHPTLHNEYLKNRHEKSKSEEKHKQISDNEDQKEAERVNCTRKDAKRVYLRILPVTLKGPDREIDTYALLDGGATVSLISEDIADQLGLNGPTRPLVTSWYNDSTTEDRESRQVSLGIRGITGKTYTIKNARTTKMRMPGQTMAVDLEKWTYLKDLDIPNLDDAIPTIMIGEDNLHVKKVIHQVSGKIGTPFATLTPLGWMVHGPDYNERPEKEFAFHIRHSDKEEELNDLVREFWTTESFGVKPSEKSIGSNEDQRARELLKKTMKRVGDRWEVGLLWKSDKEVLPESYDNAKKRLISIENKMARDPAFEKKYGENIQAYLDKGYARKLSDEEAKKRNDKTWYLPHFAVYNPQKPDKLRMVLDGAAKSRGLSLNDRLLKGPDLLKPLPGVLFRFRERKIAICGDLREMFHQIRIREEDHSSQRFLWRDKASKKMQTLEMTVMIFGAISSPFVAHEVRNRNAEEFKETYPEACDAIVNNHYVDDFLDSLDTVQDAIRKLREVIYVHKKGGFELRNLLTNSEEVRATLNSDLLAPIGKELTILGENYTRVLGVNWAPETDSFFFSTKFLEPTEDTPNKKTPTKRNILKILMSLFDPLGLLAPLTIRAKILLQDIWREGTKWDEEVTQETARLWGVWLQDLRCTEQLRIPRHYSGSIGKLKNVQLHVFCDASIQAFAAAAYLRLQGENNVQTCLVMAKTRVAPIKLLTVPRLELQSAVMGTRLAIFIQQEHSLHFEKIVFWSDSQTALGWIKSDARKYQPFVAHRIAEILDSTSPTDWRWVPTQQNVADEATRSRRLDDLENSSRWFHGPEFLCQPEAEWPSQKLPAENSSEITSEMKKEHCLMINIEPPTIDSSRFSSWTKITRVVAWVLRFIDRCKGKGQISKSGELTGTEIQRAEDHVIRLSQQEAFPEEQRMLQRNTPVTSISKIFPLSPIYKEELIKMDGRVVKDGSTFQPIILDGKNYIVRLLIAHHHKKAGHQGREKVVNDLRQRFWITNIRTAVRRSWNDCLECKHRRAKPLVPRMAPLPPLRLQDNVIAFTDTGIDYFGPIQVTIGRRREKRYGVLFTCLTIRAIHLEIAATLDTNSMIMALRRMMARRGKPARIYSDNGTNLRGASEELKKAVSTLNKDEILRQTSNEKIDWTFIPPGTPHMGGCWERLIGSVKRAMNVTLKERAPREEVLQTLFAEAEYSINSRPLTHVSDDPNDERSLTPNDFLGLTPGTVREAHGTPGIISLFSDADKLRRQWRYSQWLANQFWRRWIKEYLPSINRRAKWHRERPELKVGDLVVVWDENAPRNQWKRGRVTTVYPGRDGRIRVADLRTSTGTLKRSAARLCVLEID